MVVNAPPEAALVLVQAQVVFGALEVVFDVAAARRSLRPKGATSGTMKALKRWMLRRIPWHSTT
jgi:hypothetical protein